MRRLKSRYGRHGRGDKFELGCVLMFIVFVITGFVVYVVVWAGLYVGQGCVLSCCLWRSEIKVC